MTRGSASAYATHREPPRAQMLRRRVLSLEAYVAELREPRASAERLRRQFGAGVLPIPVPLAAGESEAQYEERFLRAYPVFRTNKSATPTGERGSRIAFAQKVAKEYVRAASAARRQEDQKKNETPVVPHDHSRPHDDAKPPPRPPPQRRPDGFMYTTQYVELAQYRRDYEAGVLSTYSALSREDKIARFGVPVVPIFVPLARGESKAQYEARFVEWIGRNGLTLAKLRADPNNVRERSLRMHFAMMTVRGELQFDPDRPLVHDSKRGHDAIDESVDAGVVSPKKLRRDSESGPLGRCRANGESSLDVFVQCGCDVCLASAVRLYAEKITDSDQHCTGARRHRSLPPHNTDAAMRIKDRRVLETDTSSSSESHVVCKTCVRGVSMSDISTPNAASDALESRLQRDFDEINEQIVLNLEALDAAVHELLTSPPVDVVEMTKLHEENEEMRGMIVDEYGKRTTALALLVVYKWRHDRRGLECMVNDKSASDVEHIQRKSYEKCMSLANELAGVRRMEDELQVLQDTSVSDEFSTTRNRIEELRRQQHQELTVLIRFDKSLRWRLEMLLRSAVNEPRDRWNER